MIEFLAGFVVFALAGFGIYLGAFFGRPAVRGSCGGNSVVRACPLCDVKEEA